MAKVSKEQMDAFKKMGLSAEEIAEVLKADAEIDKGKKMPFDLTDEQAKEAQKYTRSTSKTPTVYKMDNEGGKRSRKENPTKSAIIAEIATFLMEKSENACENVEITNKERQIAFKIGENLYELTLVQKRKPK